MKNGRPGRWPLLLIAAPAAVAIWSGWVALGGLCGFGVVNLLPGIGGGFHLNTAITLPVGVEAYAAYALAVWMWPGAAPEVRRFAGWSALGALLYGMAGQGAYHLLASHGYAVAPVPVIVLVSCMPVAVLGVAAYLTHLLGLPEDAPGEPEEETRPEPMTVPAPVSVGVSLPRVREIQRRRKCSPVTAQKIRDELQLFVKSLPAEGAPAPTAGPSSPAVTGATFPPVGGAAGSRGRGAEDRPRVPATLNGNGDHG
jgi:hypothetical protein